MPVPSPAHCSRCPNVDDLVDVLRWRLCPPCRFDVEASVALIVDRGRVTDVAKPWGERWLQLLALIQRDGFATSQSFKAATGLSTARACQYLSKQKLAGWLEHDEATGRYTISLGKMRASGHIKRKIARCAGS
jgi:hypothetical protein